MIKKKLYPTDFVEQALDEMNTNYIDLLLIHFPQSQTTPTRYNRCGKSLYQSRQQERWDTLGCPTLTSPAKHPSWDRHPRHQPDTVLPRVRQFGGRWVLQEPWHTRRSIWSTNSTQKPQPQNRRIDRETTKRQPPNQEPGLVLLLARQQYLANHYIVQERTPQRSIT